MSDFRNSLDRQMKDPEFRKEYDATEEKYQLSRVTIMQELKEAADRTEENNN